ncbi:MAG: ABC transporter permease [Firmicutes bacterium]|nr:ABC transporter permease [Bacillota bacterium]
MNKERIGTRAMTLGFAAAFIIIWWWLSQIYPTYILPSPGTVLARGIQYTRGGLLFKHFLITAGESLGGFFLGSLVALPLGYLMAKVPVLEQALAPFISASQAIPIVALAPLLIIWFGFGVTSKVLVAALVAFFPVLTNLIVGLHRTEPRAYELMSILGASRWQVFTLLEIPSALPVMFAGFRVGLALSIIGAVVGEFASSDRGLGYLVNMSAGMMDTPLLFVALFSLTVMGISFHLALLWVEKVFIPWAGSKNSLSVENNNL